MTLLAIKHNLKKAWTWLKTNWKIPLTATAILLSFFFFRSKTADLLELLSINRDSSKKQIKELNKIHEKEIKEREKILTKHTKAVKELDNKKEKIDNKIQEETREAVETLKEKDMHDLANKLKKEFDL